MLQSDIQDFYEVIDFAFIVCQFSRNGVLRFLVTRNAEYVAMMIWFACDKWILLCYTANDAKPHFALMLRPQIW
eukprot:11735846-Karenia_brevis.AAC.1